MSRKINLFCFPFAGGNKYSYQKFIENAPSLLNIIPLEYPGRGARIMEPLMSSIQDLANDLYDQVWPLAKRGDYAIYGHSMGGLLGYLVARSMVRNNHPPPLHMFITGSSAPASSSRTSKNRHLLPTPQFIQELKQLDGISDEILNNTELLAFIEPILRADFKSCETYQYGNYTPLSIPFTVITGTQEDLEPEEIQLWQNETSCPVEFKTIPGKHFFILKHPRLIVDLIAKKLSLYNKAYQNE
ncbi:thioesterase II family protein [Flavitalea antarctica]